MSNTTFGSATDAVKDTISSTVGAIDAQRKPLAKGIDSAASTLHSGADSLESTASYLRKNKVGDMLGDIGGLVKAYPTVALIGAVVLGFAAGRMLRRS